jgi:hypothetical protein
MRKWLLMILAVGLVLPGCSLLDHIRPEAKPPKLKAPAAAPVKPEHVTPENAAQKARELNDELDRELEGEPGP